MVIKQQIVLFPPKDCDSGGFKLNLPMQVTSKPSYQQSVGLSEKKCCSDNQELHPPKSTKVW